MSGTIAVLNWGTGDNKFTFDPKDEAAVQVARTIVEDMLRKGFVLTVSVGGKTERVTAFDPKTDEYTISTPEAMAKRSKGRKGRRVAAKDSDVVAVGRTAGGCFGHPAFGVRRSQLRTLGE